MQRRARTGIGADVAGLQAFLFGESLDEGVREVVIVPAALFDAAVNGGSGLVARSQRVLIGVDLDCVGGQLAAGRQLRQGGFVIERQRGAGSDHGSDPAEIPARKAAFHKVELLIFASIRYGCPYASLRVVYLGNESSSFPLRCKS